jgi:hypothetical protein
VAVAVAEDDCSLFYLERCCCGGSRLTRSRSESVGVVMAVVVGGGSGGGVTGVAGLLGSWQCGGRSYPVLPCLTQWR